MNAHLEVTGSQAEGMGYKAADFLAAAEYQTTAVGSIGLAQGDQTAVMNMPPCVCKPGCKNTMVPRWIPKGELVRVSLVGIKPVPPECYRDTFNGGKPVTPLGMRKGVDPVTGFMLLDTGEYAQVLCMTTCQREEELKAAEAEVNRKAAAGQTIASRGLNLKGESADGDSAANQMGWHVEEEFSETTGRIAVPVRPKRPMVTVPGKPQ